MAHSNTIPRPTSSARSNCRGLRSSWPLPSAGAANAHAGNCASCHQAPDFSDFVFHNNGVSQAEYDAANGSGRVHESVCARQRRTHRKLQRLHAGVRDSPECLRGVSACSSAGQLPVCRPGALEYLSESRYPQPPGQSTSFVCASGKDCSVDQGLASTIAQFKTPVLRDLEDSAPYFHNGSAAKFR